MDFPAIDGLRPFQKEFLKGALADEIQVAALSMPRGNGKSALAGYLGTRIMSPDDPLFRSGTESVLGSGSIEQARVVFKFIRDAVEDTGEYSFTDSHTRIGVKHKATNTRIRIISSKASTAMGIVNCPWAILDEPGAWEIKGGELLWTAIKTALGKPGSPMRVLAIGTLGPNAIREGHWWYDLIHRGSWRSYYVMYLKGDRDRWDQWTEIRRCNPLTMISKSFRQTLLRERDEARGDSRLKGEFLTYRLNNPTADEKKTLLNADDWRRVIRRKDANGREGAFYVGYDLGGGRAWSGATAIWENGWCEALALAPGIPDIRAQEKRDRVSEGAYQKLIDLGVLFCADGLRVQSPAMLHEAVIEHWGEPEIIVCDFFRVNELRDCVEECPVVPRRQRWSEASEDIRALRKIALDGPLECQGPSALLLTASLDVAMVENDTSGGHRMIKRGTDNAARDDVAVSLVLASGEFVRRTAGGEVDEEEIWSA